MDSIGLYWTLGPYRQGSIDQYTHSTGTRTHPYRYPYGPVYTLPAANVTYTVPYRHLLYTMTACQCAVSVRPTAWLALSLQTRALEITKLRIIYKSENNLITRDIL